MKKLSIEEKAKAYDEALARANEMIKSMTNIGGVAKVDDIQHIFPELKESEDERMIQYFKDLAPFDKADELYEKYGFYHKDAIAWLEKQCEQKIKTPEESLGIDSDTYNKIVDECIYGEQKHTDKVEPNFKVGDWVVTSYGKVNQVVSVDKYGDGYTLNDGVYFSGSWCDMYHLWTIQDAKDGDVLAWDDSKCIALFKNIYDEDSFNSYGFVGGCTCTFESRQSYHDIEGAHPATKEQRDLLFHKMHEAGYEWDAENKELIKIEHKTAWSEKDNEHVNSLLKRLDGLCRKEFTTTRFAINEDENWLKSLKERYTWKPSDEQMNTL